MVLEYISLISSLKYHLDFPRQIMWHAIDVSAITITIFVAIIWYHIDIVADWVL